jgi:DNA repair exonuclease SbcCD ATPase subunit
MSDNAQDKNIDTNPGLRPVELRRSFRNENKTEFGGLKIAHIADIHIREDAHEEYKTVLNNLYDSLKTEKPNIITILGDVFHHKKHATPQEINDVKDFLHNLQLIAPTILITGASDTVINKPGSLDLITPVIKNSNNLENLHYFRNSGEYKIPGFDNINFLITAPDGAAFTKENAIVFKPEGLEKEIIRKPGELYIALAHEEIAGRRFDGSQLHKEDFANIDLTLLGRNHDQLFLSERIAYAGSITQQSIAESYQGHGYLLWSATYPKDNELAQVKSEKISIYNPQGYLKIIYKQNTDITDSTYPIKIKAVNVEYSDCTPEFIAEQLEILKKKYNSIKVSCKDEVAKIKRQENINSIIKINDEINDQEIQEALIREYLAGRPQELIDTILDLHRDRAYGQEHIISTKSRWKIKKIKFSNMFCYGPNNIVDFSLFANCISGIIARNYSGKSAFIDIILYTLFNKYERASNDKILNNTYRDATGKHAEYFSVRIDLEIDGQPAYVMKRVIDKTPKLEFKLNDKDLSGQDITSTYNNLWKYIGTYKNALETGFILQQSPVNFVYAKNTERKRILADLFNLNIFNDIEKVIKQDKIKCKTLIEEKSKMLNALSRTTKISDMDKLKIKKGELSTLAAQNKYLISDINTELKKLYNVYRSKEQVSPDEMIDEITDAEIIELKSLENIEPLPVIEIKPVKEPDYPRPNYSPESNPKLSPNPTLLNKLITINGAIKNNTNNAIKNNTNNAINKSEIIKINKSEIMKILNNINIIADPDTLYYKDIAPLDDKIKCAEFVEITGEELAELKMLENKTLSNKKPPINLIDVKPNPKLLATLVSYNGAPPISNGVLASSSGLRSNESNGVNGVLKGASAPSPGLRPVESQGVKNEPLGIRGSNNKETIIKFLDKIGIKSDPDTLFYKEICVSKDYDEKKHKELLNNKIDITNHKNLINDAQNYKVNSAHPEEIKSAIIKHANLNKKVIAPFNIAELKLKDNCEGCANTKCKFAEPADKKQIEECAAQIATYINKLNTEIKNMELMVHYNKSCVARMLIDYQQELAAELTIVQQIEDYNLSLRRDALRKKVEAAKNYRTYAANSLFNYQNTLAATLRDAQATQDWQQYDEYKKEYEKAAQLQQQIDTNLIVAADRREKLRLKIALRTQILEDNLEDSKVELIEAEKELAMLSGQETLLAENIANLKTLENEILLEKNKLDIFDIYSKILDEATGIPNLLMKRNFAVLRNAINEVLASYTDMQIEMSDDFNINVKTVNSQSLELASGFQKFIISLAYRIAVSQISNAPMFNGLIIDEAISATDKDNLPFVVDFLTKISEKYYTLLVITHTDSLQDVIEKPLYIDRINNEYSLIKNAEDKIIIVEQDFIVDPNDIKKYYCNYCKKSFTQIGLLRHKTSKEHIESKSFYVN